MEAERKLLFLILEAETMDQRVVQRGSVVVETTLRGKRYDPDQGSPRGEINFRKRKQLSVSIHLNILA